VPPETLDAERDSLRDVVFVARLEAALRRLNPWLSDDNLQKAVRAITSVQATSLIEANEALHTALTFGIALEQDLGDGRKNQQIRFFDFDTPANNDFVVTRQFKVKGARKHVIPDVVCFVNGIPLAGIYRFIVNNFNSPNGLDSYTLRIFYNGHLQVIHGGLASGQTSVPVQVHVPHP
jgi:type I restriction enzyme R subunit